MAHDLNIIATHVMNTLNSDKTYKPVKFEHVLLFVRAMNNVKPPLGDVDKFIERVIDAIPRVPKTMTLDYLSAQLQERSSQGARGMFSMVNLYPFVTSDLNRVRFALIADNICEKFKKDEYHSASRPISFKQYSIDDLGEILDILFRREIIDHHPIDGYDIV